MEKPLVLLLVERGKQMGEFGADLTTLCLPSPLPRVSSSTDVQDAVPTIATACPLVSSYRWTFALAAATWNDCQG